MVLCLLFDYSVDTETPIVDRETGVSELRVFETIGKHISQKKK